MAGITFSTAQRDAAKHLKEVYGIDVNDPEQLAEMKVNVMHYRKRVEQTFNKQNVLHNAST